MFYSHDTFGLGHLSRCMKIARILSRNLPRVRGLLLTGSADATAFRPPVGFDTLPLPAVTKCADGSYRARGTDIAIEAVIRERSRRILDAVSGFDPDLLVVDNVPSGLRDEVMPALRNRAGRRTRCVLALRDVLDARERVRHEWRRPQTREALDIYDEVWVFGDEVATRRIMRDSGLHERASKVIACGLLGEPSMTSAAAAERLIRRGSKPRILVTGGGGGDADRVVHAYVDALRRFRPSVSSRIVLGPDFSPRAFAEITSHNGFDATFARFAPSLAQELATADVVVSMAGYNTVCELRAAGCRSVLVPRVRPRSEQWLRARRLAASPHHRVLHPETADPSAIWSAVEELIEMPRPAPDSLPGGVNLVDRAARLIGAEIIDPTETKTIH